MATTTSPDNDARRPTRAALSDETYAAIRIMLLDHTIPPGQRINIDSIARELNVSQTPVREALARLESDDLVVKQTLRGYSATELLTREEVDELFDFRALIEPWTAARAAQLHSAADDRELLDEMERGLQALELDVAQTYSAFSAHDERFHDLIARIAGNGFVHDAYARAHCQLHLFRVNQAGLARLKESGHADFVESQFSLSNENGRGVRTMLEHRLVAESILEGQENAAAARMLDHIESSRKRTIPVADAATVNSRIHRS